MMLYPVKCQPLPWYGGKAGFGKAEWIASLLPWDKNSTYVEPFGGMAGVLLRRAPVKREIFNDLDMRIVNWWRCVRNHRDELGELVEAMPHSEAEYQWAKGTVDDENESDLQRALAFYVLATQSTAQTMGKSGWITVYSTVRGSMGRWRSDRVGVLCERMWNVQLFCRTAEEILQRMSECIYSVIYADPPYSSANTTSYAVVDLDIDNLTRLFKAQNGRVAVSGYDGEWDHLGWQRHERESLMVASANFNGDRSRLEVVWTNYDAHSEQAIGGLFA